MASVVPEGSWAVWEAQAGRSVVRLAFLEALRVPAASGARAAGQAALEASATAGVPAERPGPPAQELLAAPAELLALRGALGALKELSAQQARAELQKVPAARAGRAL